MVKYLTVQESTVGNLSAIFIILKSLIIWFCLVALIFICLVIYDHFQKYDDKKLFNNIQGRTGTRSFGGGEEMYLRYWVWQRNKRKHIISILSYLTYDNRYFPKEKWKKQGRVNFPFRRECWINEHKVDRERYKEILINRH